MSDPKHTAADRPEPSSTRPAEPPRQHVGHSRDNVGIKPTSPQVPKGPAPAPKDAVSPQADGAGSPV